MSIEIALLISVVSVAFSIFFGLKNSKHADANNIETRAREMAEISVKLDTISQGTREIKEQLASLVRDVQRHSERLTKVEEMSKRNEESIKRLHERVDILDDKVDSLCNRTEAK